jgi:hypothetical protein
MSSNFSNLTAGNEHNNSEVDNPDVRRMQALIAQWEAVADQRATFLTCYLMMTRNMLSALQQHEFNDDAWVHELLHHFANYYFTALEAYEQDAQQAPPVWQVAHDAARQAQGLPIQELLLGVNAHINYDLVLTLVDMLQPEWDILTEEQKTQRYSDHCHVNDVIGGTIDAVQDQVLEPAMPVMDLIDRLLGPLDEKLVSHLISGWREQVWQNAVQLIQTREAEERLRFLHQLEDDALQLGRLIA